MAVVTLTVANFDDEVLKSELPVLVDFWADWCGPCKRLSPTVDRVAEEHPEIKVGKVNVDNEEALAVRFGIMSIPTLLVFRNGELINQSVGLISEEAILALLK